LNAVDVDWSADLQAVALTLKLAFVVTLLLLAIGTPLAWWLAHTRSRWKAPLAALVALPLVLPPTVLGFYLLMLMGPHGLVGQATQALGIGLLPFSFSGLVIASMRAAHPSSYSRSRRRSRPSARGRWRPRPRCAPDPGSASSTWRCRWRAVA
jgi:ABC-type molybdate transport system permease subunit